LLNCTIRGKLKENHTEKFQEIVDDSVEIRFLENEGKEADMNHVIDSHYMLRHTGSDVPRVQTDVRRKHLRQRGGIEGDI